jgi:hypothetical protein
MAPTRRPPRPIKESKKKSKVPTYDSFEEALDAGVVQEEKGERYRTGEKVRTNPSHCRHSDSLRKLTFRLVA